MQEIEEHNLLFNNNRNRTGRISFSVWSVFSGLPVEASAQTFVLSPFPQSVPLYFFTNANLF